MKYKIFMQALCEAKLGWDDVLTGGGLLIQWNNLVSSLHNAPQMQIPRSYLDGKQENILSYTLCGYCDASLSAYAAVVYLRIEMELTEHTKFVAPKIRVSPLKK